MLNSFGAVPISPVGDKALGMCSKLISFIITLPSNLITAVPDWPFIAQHSPGKQPALKKLF